MTAQARIALTAGIASTLSVLPLFLLIDTRDWIVPAVIAIALVIGIGYLIRHSRAPRWLALPAQLIALTLWIGVISASDVAFVGFLPNMAWLDRMSATLSNAVTVILEFAPPVPATSGITALLVGGAGLVALLVDVLVTTLDRAALTAVPLAACYVVTAAVLDQSLEWGWFVPPAVGYLMLLVAVSRTRLAAWGRTITATGRRRGMPSTDSMARSGRRVGVTALAIAVAVPAAIPMLSYGLIGTGGSGGGGRVIRTDNPMLDMRRNLQQDAPNTRIATYTPEDGGGTRLKFATLDVFTMDGWNLSRRDVPSSQNVAGGLPDPVGLDTTDLPTATYDIALEDWSYWCPDGRESCWLPMPYPPAAVDIQGDWIYDNDTLDVIFTEEGTPAGDPYRVTAYDIEFEYERLDAIGAPTADVDETLTVPDGFPDQVAETAEQVVADAEASTPLEQAVAIQEWFRSSVFTYSVEQVAGSSADAMVDFLDDRSGYCEQFSTTMAAMARHLGIPSRVALGFTNGEVQGDGSYLVRAKDMHAWPELYFEGMGWVPFEPTPATRTGAPPAWTRPAVEAPANDPSVPTGAPTGPSAIDGGDVEMPEDDLAAGSGAGGDSGPPWPLLVVFVVLGVGAIGLVPMAVGIMRRRSRWARAAGDPVSAAEAAWTELRYAARDARLPWDEAATPRMIGRSLVGAAHLDPATKAKASAVVEAVERARYSAVPRVPDDIEATARAVAGQVVASGGRPARRRARLWPRWFTSAFDGVPRAFDRVVEWSSALGERSRTAIERTPRSG